MKTWKSRRTVCRKRSSGRFARKAKCSEYKRARVRRCCLKDLFTLPLFK